MIKLFMGIPSLNSRTDAQCYRLRSMEERYKDTIQFVYPKDMVIRVSHDYARNMVVKEFLESGADILWFLDSDVVPHPDVLETVLESDKWQCAGAPYPVWITQKGWDGPQVVLTVYRRAESRQFYPCEIPPQGTDFVDGIATGCLFIKREVFSKLDEPYFEHKYDPTTRELTEGEDLGFCRKVADLGIRFYINFGHVCKHYKVVDLLDVNNYAITYANQHKLYYERLLSELAAKVSLQKLKKQSNSTPSGLVLAQPHDPIRGVHR